MGRSRLTLIAVATLVAVMMATGAAAQGTARSMDIDVSIRSAAMGGASNALFRGGELNHWGNPALLGYGEGVRYERGRTRLVPGLAADVQFTTTFIKLGAGGLGVVLGGEPAGPDGVDLDYGSSEGTDENGNPTGTFRSFEHVSSWGFGINLLQVIDQMGRIAGEPGSTLSRYVDLSLGMNFKHVEMTLGSGPGGRGGTDARDAGLLFRLTPVDRLESATGLPVRLDLAYGASILSYNDDARIGFLFEDQASPVTRHRRQGASAGLALGLPGFSPARLESRVARSLVRGFWPLLAFTATVDRARLGGGDAVDYETSGWGFEAAFANILAIRRGHCEDKVGDIDDSTSGWSVRIPIGSFGGFEHEEATFPQARNSGLEDLHRSAYAVWVNPLEIAAALRGGKDGGVMAHR